MASGGNQAPSSYRQVRSEWLGKFGWEMTLWQPKKWKQVEALFEAAQ